MTKFQQLIQQLKKDQVSEEEISILTAELIKAATLKLYTQIMSALTDEQQEALELAENEQVENSLLDAYYELHMGKSADEAITEYQEEFATNFLENYTPEEGVVSATN